MNPDSAVMCDCGQVFDSAGAGAARAAGFRARHETHPPGASVGAKIGVVLIGYFVGAFPVGFVAEYRAAIGRGDSTLLQAFAFATGIAGAVIALRLLKRRHESLAAQKRKSD